MGIGVALGALRAVVGRMFVMQWVRLGVVGVIVGVAGALATTRLLRSLLFEVQPTDPFTLVIVAGGLVVLAAIASWIPARRAMHVDPVEALRSS
jgi:putative ABC transport system permease protein